jgi:voltage-gated potassium channel
MDTRSAWQPGSRPAGRHVLGTVPGVRWLVAAVVLVALAAAVVARLVASSDFASFGEALWWSVQTVTTVGYGDVAPTTTAGRAIAGVLMVAGFAAISLVTAAVAAGFVARIQARRHTDPVLQALDRIEQRLEALERRHPG